MKAKGQVRICYRKVIDAQSQKAWDKYMFDDSYTEYRMQSQYYNQEKKYSNFLELVKAVPGAERLHFLVSAAITGYMQQLGGKIPEVTNNNGQLFLPFHEYRFEILQSDVSDKSKHVVAVHFYSEFITWYDTIGENLLVALPGNDETGEIKTEMFSLRPNLSIYSLKPIDS